MLKLKDCNFYSEILRVMNRDLIKYTIYSSIYLIKVYYISSYMVNFGY